MPEAVSVGIIIAGVAAVFAACCAAIAKAAFSSFPSKALLQSAFYQAAAFALALVGCLAVTQVAGNAAAALFSAAFCILSLALGLLLARTWNSNEIAERASIEELRRFVENHQDVEATLEERCARVAREFDLTRREEAILGLLLEGKTRPEVAEALFVSENTVKTHIRNLYKKMGVSGKAELAEVVGDRCAQAR